MTKAFLLHMHRAIAKAIRLLPHPNWEIEQADSVQYPILGGAQRNWPKNKFPPMTIKIGKVIVIVFVMNILNFQRKNWVEGHIFTYFVSKFRILLVTELVTQL